MNEAAAAPPPVGWRQPFSAHTRLLVVAPHPDDETIATGLLIQQVREAGGTVGIVLLTDGDNNPWPQRWLERRVLIRPVDRQRWGSRRREEMLQAMQRLGVPAQALQALGWPDMGITDTLLPMAGAAVGRLVGAIAQFQPNLVAAPALGDRHPDHGAAHVLVRLALATLPAPPTLLTYVVHGRVGDSGGSDIGGTAAQQANKQAALAAHRSQLALSAKRLRQLAGRCERYGVLPVAAPAMEPALLLPWQPPAYLIPWLRLLVVSASESHDWRWREAPLQRDGQGRYRLQLSASTGAVPRFAKLSLALPSPWIFDRWGWCEL